MLGHGPQIGNSFYFHDFTPAHSAVPPCACPACIAATAASDATRQAIIAALAMVDPQFSTAGIEPKHWSITSQSIHAGDLHETMAGLRGPK